MKRLLPVLMVFGVSLGIAEESFALQKCPGSYNANTWTNCEGTYYYLADNQFKGDKYVGEFRDGKKHGQGTYTSADGRVTEGIWEKGKFK